MKMKIQSYPGRRQYRRRRRERETLAERLRRDLWFFDDVKVTFRGDDPQRTFEFVQDENYTSTADTD